jgi:hypothetical protein
LPFAALAMPMPAQAFPLGCPSGASCVNLDPPGLADTAEPGSVLVFPKFAQGTIVLNNGSIEPNTQLEIAAVCPVPAISAAGASPTECTRVNYELVVHWVCPGVTVGQNASVCPETDFVVFVSTYGKIVFNPNGLTTPAITANGRISGYPALNGTTPVPQAECPRGYAIAYVVDSQLRPIARNVLIGDSVQRNNFVGPTNSDLQSYSALAIQAVNGSDGSLIATVADPEGPSGSTNAALPFDGLPNHYQMVTGQIWGDVRFNQDTANATPPTPYADTALILLTLDVRSNLPNDTTEVLLEFDNARETPISTVTSFDCWEQVQLTAIDVNLTTAVMGTPNGVVVSGQAFDVATGDFRTLLGLIQTSEGPTPGTIGANRSYTVRPSNNSIPIRTYFVFD